MKGLAAEVELGQVEKIIREEIEKKGREMVVSPFDERRIS